LYELMAVIETCILMVYVMVGVPAPTTPRIITVAPAHIRNDAFDPSCKERVVFQLVNEKHEPILTVKPGEEGGR
jgi:hypothetical protein